MTIQDLCYNNEEIQIDLIKSFINNYPNELSKDELKVLPVFIKYCLLSCSFWRFKKYKILENNLNNDIYLIPFRKLKNFNFNFN
jgi:hypothetical protein